MDKIKISKKKLTSIISTYSAVRGSIVVTALNQRNHQDVIECYETQKDILEKHCVLAAIDRGAVNRIMKQLRQDVLRTMKSMEMHEVVDHVENDSMI